ncbi:unnamed protein product [Didymodactylos carnosus]|uniref:Uncharacterized protein n=1 Tax=Didymodactylos carnosus TaxID=1234261 RepID=A0A815VWT6_9BILA|nr:unnamed protein product [Didymodactylos carnosus]CAF1537631.1 unnamed protein product [Didymodactylos carnosus]CAF4123540.1 unnamed protein product [Didymodactylos carnosus]CAF4397594.1 unnamed protein product [Didymodactylos carnosus]
MLAYNRRYLDIITRCLKECSTAEDEEKLLHTVIDGYHSEDDFLRNMLKLYGAYRTEMLMVIIILIFELNHTNY